MKLVRPGWTSLILWAVLLVALCPAPGASSRASFPSAPLPFVTPRNAYLSASTCSRLPPPSGNIIHVETVAELQNAVANLTSGTTILVADGTYDLTNTLNIRDADNVAIRSASGDRQSVILRGRGMSNSTYGNVPHVIAIYDASDVTIADMTLRDAYYHLVQIHGEDGPQRPLLYNLHLIDSGEQFIKGSTAGPPGPYSDDGEVACSLIEYTNQARSWYTNGVDILGGAGWIIRDNIFRNIRYSGSLAGPAVLMWRNSLDTIVERNLFIECARGIALGLSAPDSNSRGGETTYDHQGGIVRNNFIYRLGVGDIGITVNYARDFKIYHNTVLLNSTFPWGAIEYRFSASGGDIRYNLTDAPIWQRDGASATLAGNITNAQLSWFISPATGDLHLNASAAAAIDHAVSLADVPDDYDGAARPIGPSPDVGADEYRPPLGDEKIYLPHLMR